jgi:hypothetical protein
MRSLLCVVFTIGAIACVGQPPVPCTTCGDKCVDLQSDSKNCGTCGKICEGGTSCSAGACVPTCNNTQKVCGTSCVDIQNDPNNCGDCAHRCDPGNLCVTGICQGTCSAGYATCLTDAGTPYCSDLTQDSHNCGACGRGCGTAEACVMSTCSTQCGMNRMLCTPAAGGAFCADLNTDPNNCGACNAPCAAGLSCNGGHCDVVCNAPLATCSAGGTAHYCADTASDPNNCGACGTVCGAGQFCSAGGCLNVLASNCDELKTLFPSLGDTDTILFLNGKSYLPYRAYCADMDGGATKFTVIATVLTDDAGVKLKNDAGIYLYTDQSGVPVDGGGGEGHQPKTYLTLANTGPQLNYSQVRLGPPYPPFVQNNWTKLRFNPYTRTVRNDDFRFATVQGITQNSPAGNTEYGMAGACNGPGGDGTANIDLRMTPFTVDPANAWSADVALGASFSPSLNDAANVSVDRQSVSIIGNGSCGVFELNTNPAAPHGLVLDPSGASCASIHTARPDAGDGLYSMVDGVAGDAGAALPLMYCDMTTASGGWTLLMKVDGTNPASRFFNSDPLWTSEGTLNAGTPSLALQEAKYPTYMATPFSEVMIVTSDSGGTLRNLRFSVPEQSSMYASMAGGTVVATVSATPAVWVQTMTGTPSTIQPNCNRIGINAFVPGHSAVRLGILGNNEADCLTPDSYAGVGGEIIPAGNCAPAGFRGYSAGAFGAGICPTGGNANSGIFAYVYVR